MADIERQWGSPQRCAYPGEAAETIPGEAQARDQYRRPRPNRESAAQEIWAAAKTPAEPVESPAAQVPTPTPALAKAKRKLSKAARAAIVAATKKRWARVRAEAAKAEKAGPKPKNKSAVK
jgi:hypothetical protein